jgi:hypothetical protein
MDVFSSLNVSREMILAIQEQRNGRRDTLSGFLTTSNYFASVFSAILLLDRNIAPTVKKDLTIFIGKAKVFVMENPEFQDWWPVGREGIIMQAFRNILSGHGNEFAHFTMILAIVEEAVGAIVNDDYVEELRRLALGR